MRFPTKQYLSLAVIVVSALLLGPLPVGPASGAITALDAREGVSGGRMTPTDGEQLLVMLINQVRQRNGVRPLRLSATVSRQALPWAQMLARPGWRGRLAHSPTYWSGIQAACLGESQGAENVAGRYESWRGRRPVLAGRAARGLLRQYLHSPPHRANLLNPRATHLGVATVIRRNGAGKFYAANVLRFARAASC